MKCMKFQKKIILIYLAFMLLVIFIVSVMYYILNVRQYKERTYNNIYSIAETKLQQFNNTIESMESVATYFLSDMDVLQALRMSALLNSEDPYEDLYFSEANETIRSKLSTDYIITHFHRVIVFNKAGNVVASKDSGNKKLNSEISYSDLRWIDNVSGKNGKQIIIGEHQDDWGTETDLAVISVAKEILGNEMGFIEVQQRKSYFDQLLKTEGLEMEYLFFSTAGEVIYCSSEQADPDYYWAERNLSGDGIRTVTEPEKDRIQLLTLYSERNDLVMITINHENINQEAMISILPVAIVLLTGFSMLAFGYIYLASRLLTRPIQQLQKFMETTQIDNIEAEIPEKISNDEIESLYESYKAVLNRLHKSMIKEKQMSYLSLQAQFDLLQAQVNPHFIYNVLNVISHRGNLSDDEIICDICSDMAGMLRYSTNTEEKYATVKDEVQYLELYLNLLKHRYEHKLTYQISVDHAIENMIIPKIILQQIVENSINHGYQGGRDKLAIKVDGERTNNGWYITIHDNGRGIEPDKIEDLQRAFLDVKQKLSNKREHMELKIGGMGLINTYARLFLLYSEQLSFEVCSDSGTDVTIRVSDSHEEVVCIE